MTSFSPGRTPTGGDLRLPTPPGLVRRFWVRHPFVADALVAGAYLVPMSILLTLNTLARPERALPMTLLGAGVIAVMTAAILFRRRAPLLVLAVTWAGLLIAFPSYGEGDTIAVLIALYAVAVYRNASSAWIGLAASAVVGSLGVFLHLGSLGQPWLAVSVQYTITMLAATLIGVNVGDRKRYVSALLDRAAQLARERDQQAQLARVSERSRIAREMHDIVAHSLSVIVALADGAHAIAPKDPERARAAMLEVADTGRGGMTQMRRLLGVLADDSETDAAGELPLHPQPGLTQLNELVESFRSAGLPTTLELTGRLPRNPGVQLTVYRIVQESLTNALRYSVAPSVVAVRLRSEPGALAVSVTDDGRGGGASVPSSGSGRGLIGLGERVALYGGTLEAAATPGGGWRVRATMTFTEEEAE